MISFSLKLKRPQEFLILEITPEKADGVAFYVDDNKNLEIRKFWNSFTPQDFSRWFRKNNHCKLVVSVDHCLITSLFLPLKWERESTNRATLTLVDLENFLFQEAGKMFRHCQDEAARKLRVDYSDAIMIGGAARGFRVDGYKVIDPVGFPAKRVEVILELIFASRHIFEKWREILPNQSFLAESGRAAISVLRKIKKSPINLLIFDLKESLLFSFDDKKSAAGFFLRKTLPWGINNLIEPIVGCFGVRENIARRIYDAYLCGEISSKLSKKISQLLKLPYKFLEKELEKNHLKGDILSARNFDLPILLPTRKIVLKDISYSSFLEDFGFKIKQNKRLGNKENFWFKPLKFAPFLEFYFHQENLLPIDIRLKRYLYWLSRRDSVE